MMRKLKEKRDVRKLSRQATGKNPTGSQQFHQLLDCTCTAIGSEAAPKQDAGARVSDVFDASWRPVQDAGLYRTLGRVPHPV